MSTANQKPENNTVCRDASGLESYIHTQQNPFCRRRRAMVDGGECALCCSLHCLAPAIPSASAAAVRHAAQTVPPSFQILFSRESAGGDALPAITSRSALSDTCNAPQVSRATRKDDMLLPCHAGCQKGECLLLPIPSIGLRRRESSSKHDSLAAVGRCRQRIVGTRRQTPTRGNQPPFPPFPSHHRKCSTAPRVINNGVLASPPSSATSCRLAHRI